MMEWTQTIVSGIIAALTITAVSVVFKFLLDGFGKHLGNIEQSWRDLATQIRVDIREVRVELKDHIDEEAEWRKSIDNLVEITRG